MTPPLPLAQAQARLLAMAAPLDGETIAADQAQGRFLSVSLVAARTQPAADVSAMDGYALRAGGAGPWRIVGESAAGRPFAGEVGAGEAVRISTGALMPRGTDAVLLQEEAQRTGEILTFRGKSGPDTRHVRLRGFDFRLGEEVLPAGTRIGPAQLALAIAAGHDVLQVHRLPRIAIIDSGDELSGDPGNCAPHQIPASNGPMLAALCEGLAGETLRIGPVPDRLDALGEALGQAGAMDVIVTSGGASVGDHDLLRPALAAWGAQIAFWRVALKPGKPLLVARKGRQIVLGLPGNPVSSYVTAYLFLLPLLRALAGAGAPLPTPAILPAGMELPPGGARHEFIRAIFDGTAVAPLAEQDSSALRTLARANALIERPVRAPAVAAGGPVAVHLLETGGLA